MTTQATSHKLWDNLGSTLWKVQLPSVDDLVAGFFLLWIKILQPEATNVTHSLVSNIGDFIGFVSEILITASSPLGCQSYVSIYPTNPLFSHQLISSPLHESPLFSSSSSSTLPPDLLLNASSNIIILLSACHLTLLWTRPSHPSLASLALSAQHYNPAKGSLGSTCETTVH